LICNYISRIDESLQNEFIRLRFNQLPKESIQKFLKNIVLSEELLISDKSIQSIQTVYQSDIRSMINYIQSNQNILSDYKIINYETWDNLTHIMGTMRLEEVNKFINNISNTYGIEKKSLLKEYFNYMIYDTGIFINSKVLYKLENLIHNTDLSTEYYTNYAVLMIGSILRGNTLL
jgi:replication factor C subunit 3/5